MRHFLFFLFVFLFACGKNTPADDRKSLVVNDLQPAALQDFPGKKGKKIREISTGQPLVDLGEVSRFISSVEFGDTVFRAPWLRVQLPDDTRGWVFAAAVSPKKGDAAVWQRGKLLDAFLGHDLTLRLAGWQNGISNAATDRDFSENYLEGIELRDSVVRVLTHRSEPGEEALSQSYFLIKDVLPGFVMQTVGTGNEPFLFADFKYFSKMAAETSGDEDDIFFKICQTAFPADSIESFFPGWTIQLDDVTSASLLGSGKHLDFLKKMNRAAAVAPLFQPEFARLTDLFLEDILRKDALFWHPKTLAINELRQILTEKFTNLSDRDRVALGTRLASFEKSSAGLRFDLRGLGF